MIIGIGTDIIQIPRVEKLLEKYRANFKRKILSINELELIEKLPENKHAKFLAKRFAAKEAISKALGTGIGANIGFKDITVLNDKKGKPYVNLSNGSNINHLKIDISISDDYPIAVAFSVIST